MTTALVMSLLFGIPFAGMIVLLVEPIVRNLDFKVQTWDYDQLYGDEQ